MPIREWINSNRSRCTSHSTCDTVLKNVFQIMYTYDDIATPKRKKIKTRKTTHCRRNAVCIGVCVCTFADLVNIFFPNRVNTETKAKCKTFLCARLLLWMDIWMMCWFVLCRSFSVAQPQTFCQRLYNTIEQRTVSVMVCWCVIVTVVVGMYMYVWHLAPFYKIIHNCGRVRVFWTRYSAIFLI